MSLQLIEEPNKRGNQINYKKAASFDGDDAEDELQLWKHAEGNAWSNGKWRLKNEQKMTSTSWRTLIAQFVDQPYLKRSSWKWQQNIRIMNQQTAGVSLLPSSKSSRKKLEDGKTAQIIKQDLMNMPNITNVPFLRQIQNFSAYQKKDDLSPSTLEDLRDYAASKQMCLLMKMSCDCTFSTLDKQEPAICPKISPEVFKEAYQLEQEKRPFFRSPQNNLFVMPSSSARDKNTADLYEKLLQGGWTFLQLKEYKAAFHVIVPSLEWPNHFSYCGQRHKRNKQSHYLIPLIDVAVGSIINQLTFGFRFIGETRKEFYELKAIMAEHVQMFTEPFSSLVIAMPWLRYFPRQYKRKKENGVWKEDDTYLVDAFLHEMEQNTNKEEKDQYFNMNSLRGLAPDFFFAGQETTSNTLNFLCYT
uniref:Uncharacterized protein n=1 Tax=Ditylenchus dipsaci TaxID=166011 RepID=A0A915DMF7_9BILA